VVGSTTETGPCHLILQFFESGKVSLFLPFEWVKHADSAINGYIKYAVGLLAVYLATLYSRNNLTDVVTYQRLHYKGVRVRLKGVFFYLLELDFHFYVK